MIVNSVFKYSLFQNPIHKIKIRLQSGRMFFSEHHALCRYARNEPPSGSQNSLTITYKLALANDHAPNRHFSTAKTQIFSTTLRYNLPWDILTICLSINTRTCSSRWLSIQTNLAISIRHRP